MVENTRSDERVSVDEQRATWENFAFCVTSNGYVNVENLSYGDESGEHIYSVEVSDSSATGCSCPHATYRDAFCKHQHAVEQSPIVVSSATATGTSQVATDGGQDIDDRFRVPEDPKHVEEPGTVDLSRCPGCSRLTQHDTCRRDRCEDAGEVNETPL